VCVGLLCVLSCGFCLGSGVVSLADFVLSVVSRVSCRVSGGLFLPAKM